MIVKLIVKTTKIRTELTEKTKPDETEHSQPRYSTVFSKVSLAVFVASTPEISEIALVICAMNPVESVVNEVKVSK